MIFQKFSTLFAFLLVIQAWRIKNAALDLFHLRVEFDTILSGHWRGIIDCFFRHIVCVALTNWGWGSDGSKIVF